MNAKWPETDMLTFVKVVQKFRLVESAIRVLVYCVEHSVHLDVDDF